MGVKLNKDKRIGKVLFIVEGERTEFLILRKIFTTIFDYQLETEKRNKKIYKKYIKNANNIEIIRLRPPKENKQNK